MRAVQISDYEVGGVTTPRPLVSAAERTEVFISYSHDSNEHREKVLGLSERLRRDGFETRLDLYVNGTPVASRLSNRLPLGLY